ncbi:hypothetical protein LHP98_13035 [Rhodobacter sp. Har01]|uniref:hypothetical protein n=1 Tax=Rhodobacter sp. Har01 TaxID=2883999 RepID=UPI001D072F0A|nr:hypothetical protein [Rhodobacter sp. Har01]MCB6179047.1 hypothetical protein [Rhodobacter sp. Har01]
MPGSWCATVPVCYESRLEPIELPEGEKPKVDAKIKDLTEDEAASEKPRLQRQWSTVEAPVTAEKRLCMVVEGLVARFQARAQVLSNEGEPVSVPPAPLADQAARRPRHSARAAARVCL